MKDAIFKKKIHPSPFRFERSTAFGYPGTLSDTSEHLWILPADQGGQYCAESGMLSQQRVIDPILPSCTPPPQKKKESNNTR